MPGASQSRNADNEFFAGLMPLREATADQFPLSGPADAFLSAVSAQVDVIAKVRAFTTGVKAAVFRRALGGGGPGSTAVTSESSPAATRGWNVARFVEWGKIDEEKDERSYKRDKEYAFRPKFGPMVIDQVNYRHFANPPAGNPSTAKWRVRGDDVGFETSTVSDFFGSHKSEVALPFPSGVSVIAKVRAFTAGIRGDGSDVSGGKNQKGWNPSHMNGPNRSTLLISRQPMEKSDRDPDLPARYFGRMVDVIVPWATQNIKLTRTEFIGSDSFKKSTPAAKEYTEGVFKAMWNITVDDQPIDEALDQKNEHDGGPGQHGFGPHKYISGLPVDVAEDVKREIAPPPTSSTVQPSGVGSTVVQPAPSTPGITTAASRTAPKRLFQGGWLYDGKQDAMAQIHDIITIVPRTKAGQLPRWRNRFNQPIGIAVIRHDAHFTKRVTELSPAPGADAEYMSGRLMLTKPFQ